MARGSGQAGADEIEITEEMIQAGARLLNIHADGCLGAHHSRHVAERVFRASEIGEYNYCSRAWWYKHVAKLSPGVETAARLEVGRNAHKQHGRAVALSLKGVRVT